MTKASIVAIALLLTCALTGFASAGRVEPGWMKLAEAARKAEAAGYTALSKIEADDGRWEGEGTKNGAVLKFHMDPRSGAISDEHPGGETNHIFRTCVDC